MRIFAISGFSKTGKTTVITELIRKISSLGLSVATVKNSDCFELPLSAPATDTAKHLASGASISVLRGPSTTVFELRRQLSLEKIISELNSDIVILEGFGDLDVPKIVTAATPEDALKKHTTYTFAFSGKLADVLPVYCGLPVLNCFYRTAELLRLALVHSWSDVSQITRAAKGKY